MGWRSGNKLKPRISELSSSAGKRSGDIPYKDSNVTRILQHSLVGNARRAIICTPSSAMRHFEQSPNTFSFSTRAKEVTDNAEVNMERSSCRLSRRGALCISLASIRPVYFADQLGYSVQPFAIFFLFFCVPLGLVTTDCIRKSFRMLMIIVIIIT